jgi:para-nitrobenzyl esterase
MRSAAAAILLTAGLLLAAACAQLQPGQNITTLDGTAWRLVKFRGGDDTVLVPDDRAKYTIAFGADGRVAVRFDCNRGSGGWTSPGPNQLQFGPMAMTRAMCPPGSLHDPMVKHWFYVRSYVVKEGRLYLSLMADGGIYEFEPLPR